GAKLELIQHAELMNSKSDWLTVLRFARTCEPVCGPVIPSDPQVLLNRLEQSAGVYEGEGTAPSKLMEQILIQAESAPMPVTVCIWTDGGIDEANGLAALESAGAKIANSRKLKALVLIGLEPEARVQWQKALA